MAIDDIIKPMAAERIIKEKYLLGPVIKEAPLSALYRAEETAARRIVWAECYKSDNLSSAVIQKIINLASSLLRLDHPGILKVIDFSSETDGFWLITQASPGQFLTDFLAEKTKLNADESLEIILQTIQGLLYASKNLITHGALNPDRLIIEKDGRVKIFGLAVESSIIAEVHLKTDLFPVKGVYFAPEQFKGEFFRETSDLYSLGLIFFTLLAGRPPFDGPDNATLAYKQQKEAPDFSSISAPEFIKEIMAGLLQKEPSARFASWENLGDFLKAKGIIKSEAAAPIPLPEALPENQPIQETNPPLDSRPTEIAVKSWGLKKWLTGLLLFLAGAVFGLSLAYFSPAINFFKPEVAIPELRDKPSQQAEEILKLMNLRPVISGELPDTRVDKGRIIFSEPKEKTLVKAGRIIRLYVSSGRTLIRVPRLIGNDLETAQKLLEGTGCRLELDAESQAVRQPKAVIVAQAPLPDSEMSSGSPVEVSLVSSKKLSQSPVPLLTGKDLLKAKEVLDEARLNLGRVIYQGSAMEDKDKIIDQNPRAGVRLAPFMPVDLIAGGGPELARVPVHQARVEFILPQRTKMWLVELKVEDTVGLFSVYQKAETGGRIFSWTVLGTGESTVKIFLDGQLIKEQKF